MSRWTRLAALVARVGGLLGRECPVGPWPCGHLAIKRYPAPDLRERRAVLRRLLPQRWRRIFVERERAIALGVRLRTMREAAGLSQEDLARQTGLGADFYERLESGNHAAMKAMHVDLLWAVTYALQSDPAEFFRGLD